MTDDVVDWALVAQRLGAQIGVMTTEIVARDGIIEKLRVELSSLLAVLDSPPPEIVDSSGG